MSTLRFFRLTHPEYATDHEDNARNPVESVGSHMIPGINCKVCGVWSSTDRLRVPIPEAADEFAQIRFLPVEEWSRQRQRWAAVLGVPEQNITPGADIGPPMGVCKRTPKSDAVHPFPGLIWVTPRVMDEFLAANYSGLSFARVEFSKPLRDVELWEMVVLGRAWREGSTPESLVACEICGRMEFPAPKNIVVDERQWDGSDFFFVDENPSVIVVTERVAEFVATKAFSNLATIDLA